MIKNSFYLSDERNIEKTLDLTELSMDELEQLVGRFKKHSHRHNKLRGEVVEYFDGSIEIRHHFTKKRLWTSA
jgi:hypothetical protein